MAALTFPAMTTLPTVTGILVSLGRVVPLLVDPVLKVLVRLRVILLEIPRKVPTDGLVVLTIPRRVLMSL